MDSKTRLYVAMASMLIAGIGGLMDWACVKSAFGSFCISGTGVEGQTGDGYIVIGLAAVGLLLAAIAVGRLESQAGGLPLVGALLCALGTGAIAVWKLVDLNSVAQGSGLLMLSPGIGLYLILIFSLGSIAMLIAASYAAAGSSGEERL